MAASNSQFSPNFLPSSSPHLEEVVVSTRSLLKQSKLSLQIQLFPRIAVPLIAPRCYIRLRRVILPTIISTDNVGLIFPHIELDFPSNWVWQWGNNRINTRSCGMVAWYQPKWNWTKKLARTLFPWHFPDTSVTSVPPTVWPGHLVPSPRKGKFRDQYMRCLHGFSSCSSYFLSLVLF